MLKDNAIIYKAEKDGEEFLGSNREIGEKLNITPYSLPALVKRGYKIHGYRVTVFGHYRKLYEVYENDACVYSGTLDEVSKHLCFVPTTIYIASITKNKLLLDKYKIVQSCYKVVNTYGRTLYCDYEVASK